MRSAALGILVAATPAAYYWSQRDTPPAHNVSALPALDSDKVSATPALNRADATSRGSTLFHDDFLTRKGGWPDTSASAEYGGSYKDGSYRYQSRKRSETWWSSPKAAAAVYPVAPSNIRVSASARWSAPDDAAWFGLVCRANDNDAYIFVVAEGAAHIAKMKNGIYDELAGEPLRGATLNTRVQLEAECATTNADHTTMLIMRVNGQRIVETTDTSSPLETGTVGVTVEMSPQARNAEAEFEDFTVSRI